MRNFWSLYQLFSFSLYYIFLVKLYIYVYILHLLFYIIMYFILYFLMSASKKKKNWSLLTYYMQYTSIPFKYYVLFILNKFSLPIVYMFLHFYYYKHSFAYHYTILINNLKFSSFYYIFMKGIESLLSSSLSSSSLSLSSFLVSLSSTSSYYIIFFPLPYVCMYILPSSLQYNLCM